MPELDAEHRDQLALTLAARRSSPAAKADVQMSHDTCYSCGKPVNPATVQIVWTYATGSDESYCTDCWPPDPEEYDPHGDGCDECGGEDHTCDTCPTFRSPGDYERHVREDH